MKVTQSLADGEPFPILRQRYKSIAILHLGPLISPLRYGVLSDRTLLGCRHHFSSPSRTVFPLAITDLTDRPMERCFCHQRLRHLLCCVLMDGNACPRSRLPALVRIERMCRGSALVSFDNIALVVLGVPQ
jgi:hypothetical protein